MIKVNNLSYRYNKNSKDVFKNLSFEVEKGKVSIILGPNGIGKSTLLKCIDKIFLPSEGSIEILGKSLHEYKRNELAKVIGYVSQDSKVSYLNVYETIMLGRTPYIVYSQKTKDYELVNNLLKEFKMETLIDRPFNSLSGGEKQIVMILRCLAQETPIIILDEPTANLDIKNTVLLLKFIKRLIKEKELTILIAMHDIPTAYLIADTFVLLYKDKANVVEKENLKEQNIYDIFGTNLKIDNAKKLIYLGEELDENN